jgi:Fe-S cluster assembly ATP-binding protein
MSELVVKNLHVNVEDVEILKGVDLTIKSGETHAIMGPNGTGKSTLAYALMGHPKFEVTQGEAYLDGENILAYDADERAHKGIFLAFQYPVAVPGVSVANFLRSALNAKRKAQDPEDKGISIPEYRKLLKEKMDLLEMDHSFASRYLNEGFSGGEKKRVEILQMAALDPKFSILDETDSGLDIDALKVVADGVNSIQDSNQGILLITHYQRILNYIKPDYVHVMLDGRIVESGGPELALRLEEEGYEWLREKHAV